MYKLRIFFSTVGGLGAVLLMLILPLMPPTSARAAIIGTPTPAGLLVCVNHTINIKPAGDVGAQISDMACNTPSAGRRSKTVGGSKVLGLATIDGEGPDAIVYVRVPGVPTTTTYTLTFSVNLGSTNLVVGGSVDYRAGDFSHWHVMLGF